MSLIRKYHNMHDADPSIIMDIVDEYTGPLDLVKLDQFRASIVDNLGGSVRTLAEASKGKNISVILNALLGELPKMIAGESVFLEKYLVDNNNPVMQCSVSLTLPINLSLKEESLELLRIVGARTTVLYYLLIMYHMN